MDIAARITPTGRAGTERIDGLRIRPVAGIAHVEFARPREGKPGAAGAGRHHAIEHVGAALDRAYDVLGPSHARQITRRPAGQESGREVEDAEHLALALADGEPPDGKAIEADAGQRLCRFPA